MSRMLGLALLVALVAVAPLTHAQDPSGEVPTGPEGVHVAYGEDPSSTMRIAWTGPPAQDAQVLYGAAVLQNSANGTPAPLPGTPRVAYNASLAGLQPDTTYKYAVETNGNRSATYRFTTAPPPGSADGGSFTFAAWADHGIQDPRNPLAGPDNEAPNRNVDLARSLDPDFHIVPGDISYANGYPPTWDRYFGDFQPYLAETPYMTVPGNHEREPGQGYTQYDARLKVPDEPLDRWYAFRYGNALFVGLNNGEMCREEEAVQAAPIFEWDCGGGAGLVSSNTPGQAKRPNPAQVDFLKSQLQRAQGDDSIVWTVVFHHYPAYSSAAHGSHPDVQRFWEPVYDRYGVDLVVTGHDHVYQRSKPMAGGNASEVGTTYVTNGAGGDGRYSFDEHPDWEAASVGDTWGTAAFHVDGDRLTGRFLDLDGVVRDEFVLEDREDGATLVNLSAQEGDEDEEAPEPEPPEPEPEPNRNETATPPRNATTPPEDDGGGGENATPQVDSDGEGGPIPGPGVAVGLASATVAAAWRRR